MSKIEILLGSNVDDETDVVVNAANKYLLAGGGVCGAIFQKAGLEELQSACDKIATPLEDGDAVITPSFGIENAKYVIHAVGPDFREDQDAFDKLNDAYFNTFMVTMQNNLRAVSLPLISSGIFAGELERPSYESAKQCVLAYNKFVEMYPDYELDVRLFAFKEEVFGECQAALEEFLTKPKNKVI